MGDAQQHRGAFAEGDTHDPTDRPSARLGHRWGRDRAHTLFAQTMALVALTAGVFALGAYLGRDLNIGLAILAFLAALGSLVALNSAVSRTAGSALALLATFGFLTGLATAPTLAYWVSADSAAVWESAAATGLFVAAFGAVGYATRRDITVLARVGTWALLALIVLGIVLVFVHIPHGALVYGVLGLLVFAALTAYDFQRLRRLDEIDSAPLLAASIFLDILNVFLLFLDLFGGRGES